MKRLFITVIAAFAMALAASAQEAKLAPGIYAVVGEEVTHLTYTNGTAISSGTNLLGFELGNHKYKYKGATSGVQATNKLVMVINPEKKGITKTPKKYDPFIKSMTPANIIIIPLDVDKDKRIYDEGTLVEGINTTRKARMDFEWEMVDENTFEIVGDFAPGEYAVVFKPSKLGELDFTSIYGFFVTE